MGIFNATLKSESKVVGPSVLAHSSTFDDLTVDTACMVALNTWHVHQPATYYSSYSTTGSSQIDFVVTRQRM